MTDGFSLNSEVGRGFTVIPGPIGVQVVGCG
jgi:hypothetical protein